MLSAFSSGVNYFAVARQARGRRLGKFGWSPTRQEALDWSLLPVNFTTLLDILVSKGVISEGEKQRIAAAKP